MNIQAILTAEKGRTAQAQEIFAARAQETGVKEFNRDECKVLRAWFKENVIPFDAFFASKAGNDALCHGLKNLQKGVQAQKVKQGQQDGTQDDQQNGTQDGTQDDQQNGTQDGTQDGQQDGTQDGTQDDQQNGTQDGTQDDQQNGTQDGTQDGQQDGTQDGTQDDQQNGTQDGTQDDQQNGTQDGTQDGQQDGPGTKYDDLTEEEKECYSLMEAGMIPYLYGPAGTGKTTAAEHIAAALGLKFYFTPSVFDKFDLTGFVDANGRLIDTPFIKAFTQGGVFLFDEWDVSDPQAVKFFNMVLSQRMFVIPKYGCVTAHKDFKIIAAGNTKGTGATANYPTALTQDASCRNRFIPIYYGYNEAVESMLAHNDAALISFVHDLRAAVKEAGLDTVISYRNVINCKNMEAMPYYKGKDALRIKRAFAGDFDADNFDMVSANLTTNNKYTRLFKGLEID